MSWSSRLLDLVCLILCEDKLPGSCDFWGNCVALFSALDASTAPLLLRRLGDCGTASFEDSDGAIIGIPVLFLGIDLFRAFLSVDSVSAGRDAAAWVGPCPWFLGVRFEVVRGIKLVAFWARTIGCLSGEPVLCFVSEIRKKILSPYVCQFQHIQSKQKVSHDPKMTSL